MKSSYFIKTSIAFALFILLFFPPCHARQSKTDSLKRELEKPMEDTVRLKVLMALVTRLQNRDIKKAMKYAREGYELAIKNDRKRGKSAFAQSIGIIYFFKGENDSALYFFKKALEYCNFYGPVVKKYLPKDRLTNKLLIGQTYASLGKGILALEYYQQALKDAQAYGQYPYIYSCLFNIAQQNRSLGLMDEAEKLTQQCLDMARENKDTGNIALAIGEFSTIYRDKKQYAKALKILPEALRIFEKHRDKRNIAISKQCMAYYSVMLGKPDDYIAYAHEAKQALTELEDKNLLIQNDDLFGKYYQAKKMYKKAFEYFNKSLRIAIKEKDMGLMEREYSYLSDLYGIQGNYKLAYENSRRQIELQDSLKEMNLQKNVMQFAVLYETEQKEKEIVVLSQKNQAQKLAILQRDNQIIQRNNQIIQRNNQLYLMGGSTLFLIAIALLLHKQNKLKNQKKQSDLEQKALRSQMNPHFTFNALTSIQDYIMGNDKISASQYLSRFSKLMRQILESSREDFISLDTEINTLDNYLAIEQLLQSDKFDYSIHVDKAIDTEEIFIPPMLIQPFIENGIKHGFLKMKEKGLINIKFEVKNNTLYCEISDNGIGRKKALEIQPATTNVRKSLGMEIVKERTKLFNRKNKDRINISVNDIVDKTNEVKGTKAEIIFPILHKRVGNFAYQDPMLN